MDNRAVRVFGLHDNLVGEWNGGDESDSELTDDSSPEPVCSWFRSGFGLLGCCAKAQEDILKQVLAHPVAVVYDFNNAFSWYREMDSEVYLRCVCIVRVCSDFPKRQDEAVVGGLTEEPSDVPVNPEFAKNPLEGQLHPPAVPSKPE